MDHLLAIKVFCRVVETGTFSRAADLLDMPKSTVTKLVQELEAHLRLKLLHRTTRRVTVTMEGAAYYERTTKLLHELEDIESNISNEQSTPRGRLKVDMASAIANFILLPALPSFMQQYPEIQLELGVSDTNIDLLTDNIDCVIRGGELNDTSLIAKRIAELTFVTCAAPSYLQQYGTPQTPDELSSKHRIIYYRSRKTNRVVPLRFSNRQQSMEIQQQGSPLSVNDSTAQLTATLSGLGVSQLPLFMAQPFLDNGKLQLVLPDWQRAAFPLYLIYPPGRHLSGRLSTFINWVMAVFQPYRPY
ncbi:DNA-binding transcriptional regulator, LysR family [Rheinheimera pacifica]|uniref:DNA-binding transcriptional regulator, LysR family n=1 Tax=Rheinheimera pacifica TaxID=173990 RepID=A0A1H6MLG5_9GAMM|nr:LysR family transcriptional regulator [Rheinheimera pacifica]SEI02608.1 DNA-binding transcriptional regulator, LysR family [Rheinheimera pacifica]